MASEADYRRIAFALPEVIEEPYYGSPSFKVGKKFLSRLREDGVDIVIPMNRDERDFWMDQQPELFHVTPHYENSHSVLVSLAEVDVARLEQLLHDAWLFVAPPAVRKAHPEMA